MKACLVKVKNGWRLQAQEREFREFTVEVIVDDARVVVAFVVAV